MNQRPPFHTQLETTPWKESPGTYHVHGSALTEPTDSVAARAVPICRILSRLALPTIHRGALANRSAPVEHDD